MIDWVRYLTEGDENNDSNDQISPSRIARCVVPWQNRVSHNDVSQPMG